MIHVVDPATVATPVELYASRRSSLSSALIPPGLIILPGQLQYAEPVDSALTQLRVSLWRGRRTGSDATIWLVHDPHSVTTSRLRRPR